MKPNPNEIIIGGAKSTKNREQILIELAKSAWIQTPIWLKMECQTSISSHIHRPDGPFNLLWKQQNKISSYRRLAKRNWERTTKKKYHTKHTHILNFLLKRGTRANNKTHRDPKQCSHGRFESIVCVCGSCVVHLIAYCRVDSIKCTSTAALVSMFKFNLAPKNSCRVSFFFILLSLYFPFMCMEHDCTLVTVLLLLFASSLPHASIAFCFIFCPPRTHS